MALTTTQLRAAWGPACQGTKAGLGDAYKHLDAIMKKYNYAPRSGVTGSYNCRKITGGSGYSLHAFGPGGTYTLWTGVRVSMALAVDINWDKNPYGPRLITDMPQAMVNEIKAVRTNSGKQVWGWGGDYRGNKDAMHYEIVCAPADISTGIKGSVPTPTPPPPHPLQSIGDKVIFVVQGPGTPVYFTDWMSKRTVNDEDMAICAWISAATGNAKYMSTNNGKPHQLGADQVDFLQRLPNA